jgi:uncharacterized membrane protein YgdD (TMEM256/DUF423 family)
MRINLNTNIWIFLAAANGFVAVGASALGSHYLAGQVDENNMLLFAQAADFQMSHALVMFFTGLLMNNSESSYMPWLNRAGQAFFFGTLMFSGSLYWLAISGPGSLGPFHFVTPIGGILLLFGWLVLSVVSFKTMWPGTKV